MTQALCFDMYGTLCDTSSIASALQEELDLPAQVLRDVDVLWRQKQLQYSYQLGQMETYRPFWEATAEALDYALAHYGQDPDAKTRERLLDAYNYLDPFPDALAALERLNDDYTVAVLSNGSPEMLETLAANAGIDRHVDRIVSADEVETFKPAPAVYENAAAQLGEALEDCALVSSNAWDVAGATQAGMGAFWVNRNNESMERIGGDPDRTTTSLAGLADTL